MKSPMLLSISIAVAALLSSGMTLEAGTSSPLIALYRVNGVADDGGAPAAGVATSFLCTNWNTVPEAVQIFARSNAGLLVAGTIKITISANGAASLSTHNTNLFGDASIGTGAFQGSALILGTSSQISCTAMMIDASLSRPSGVALHMVRFNALAGSQE